MMFAVRVTSYGGNTMLNICDSDLLGSDLRDGNRTMQISRRYYGDRVVDRQEAASLLKSASIINIAGKSALELSTDLGIGTSSGTRHISEVPFLIVFRM